MSEKNAITFAQGCTSQGNSVVTARDTYLLLAHKTSYVYVIDLVMHHNVI